MSVIGYARVSSYGQSLDVQLSKLQHCDRIFKEKQSGRSTDKREQLALCLDYVREGDLLVVTKLDRIARSVLDFHQILKTLETKQVKFICLDQNIDTTTAEGRLLLAMLSAISQFENDLRLARQLDGIAHAKQKGVKFGRRKSLSEKQLIEVRERRENGELISDLMSAFSCSKATIYRALEALRH